jgi:hypothetical protein
MQMLRPYLLSSAASSAEAAHIIEALLKDVAKFLAQFSSTRAKILLWTQHGSITAQFLTFHGRLERTRNDVTFLANKSIRMRDELLTIVDDADRSGGFQQVASLTSGTHTTVSCSCHKFTVLCSFFISLWCGSKICLQSGCALTSPLLPRLPSAACMPSSGVGAFAYDVRACHVLLTTLTHGNVNEVSILHSTFAAYACAACSLLDVMRADLTSTPLVVGLHHTQDTAALVHAATITSASVCEAITGIMSWYRYYSRMQILCCKTVVRLADTNRSDKVSIGKVRYWHLAKTSITDTH